MSTDSSGPESSDPLLQAAARVFSAREADKFAVWLAVGAAGIGLFFILAGGWESEWWVFGALVVGAALIWRIARVVIYRAVGLGHLPLFGGDIQARTLTPPPASDQPLPAWIETAPRSAAVARLPFRPEVAAEEVVAADVVNVETLRGGLPEIRLQDLPMGVFLVTGKGVAFLPGDQGRLEGIMGDLPAGMVTAAAGMVFSPIDIYNHLQTISDSDKRPTLGEWVTESLMHRHAFVIPWGDLTHVLVGTETMVLTRETADGTRSDHVVLDGSRVWPTFLMQHRIVSDLKEAVFQRQIEPKFQELLPVVVAEHGAKGEDVTIGDPALRIEAEKRALDWFRNQEDAGREAELKQALAPALSGYALLPKVVENQPWLFKP